jgi:periplasmic protein TonB
MGERMNYRYAIALLTATGFHGALIAAAWWAMGHAPSVLPEQLAPAVQLIQAQWIPSAPEMPAHRTASAKPTATEQFKTSRPLTRAAAPAATNPKELTKIELKTSARPDTLTTPSSASPAPPSTVEAAPATQPRAVSTPPTAPTLPRLDASQTGNPAPVYPVASKRLGEQGRVVLRLHVQADGSVGEVQLHTSSGYERLDESAIRAVKRWIYRPARQGDLAIAWWYQQPVTFTLENSNAN